MARPADDLLDVSPVNTGKLGIERRVVEIASLINEAGQ